MREFPARDLDPVHDPSFDQLLQKAIDHMSVRDLSPQQAANEVLNNYRGTFPFGSEKRNKFFGALVHNLELQKEKNEQTIQKGAEENQNFQNSLELDP